MATADPAPAAALPEATTPAKSAEEMKVPSYPNSYPSLNAVDIYRSIITEELVKITGLKAEDVYPALQWQNNLSHGDLLLAVPRFRIKGAKPADLAKEWVEKFPAHPMLSPPEVDGIYIRFRFSPEKLASTLLPMVFRYGDAYGMNPAIGLKDPADPSKGQKSIIVEFSSPNIAKEFHAGHLRSTIIGAFIANLYEGMGWKVRRSNYLGDWGRQYGLLAVAWQKFGNEQEFQTNPIRHLFDIYVKISALFKEEEDNYKKVKEAGGDTATLENQGLMGESKRYFKRMEEGDEEALSLWRRFRELSIEKYKETYARLGIKFDDFDGESTIKTETMLKAEKILADKKISEIDEGATIINYTKQGNKRLQTAIIRNRNGTTNYLLRDVGNLMQRIDKYDMDKVIYVVMMEQDLHLARAYKAVELLGEEPYSSKANRAQHVTYGKVMGMSTRKGTVKFLAELLDEVGDAMHEVMRANENKYAQVENPKQTADILGISAVMAQDMSGKRINNYPFDLNRMLSFEGDTGPYLQYAHARLCSINRKAGYTPEQLRTADFSLLSPKGPDDKQGRSATDLLRLMAQFPDTVLHTMTTLEPTTILTYLFKLTHALSSSYDLLRVIGAPEGPEVARARGALYEGARQTLGNGMRLLGFRPVERM